MYVIYTSILLQTPIYSICVYVLIYKFNLTVMYIYRYIPSVCLRSLEEQSGFSRGQRTALGTLRWLRRSHTTTRCKGH